MRSRPAGCPPHETSTLCGATTVEPMYGAVLFASETACEHDEADGAMVGRNVGALVRAVGAVVVGFSDVGTVVGSKVGGVVVGAVVGEVAFSEMDHASTNEPVLGDPTASITT